MGKTLFETVKYKKLGEKYGFTKYLLVRLNVCLLLMVAFVLVFGGCAFLFVLIRELTSLHKLSVLDSTLFNHKLTELEALKLVEKDSNIAGLYWLRWKNIVTNKHRFKQNVSYCDDGWIKLTSPYDIKYNNRHWQVFDSYADADDKEDENIRMFLFNAYYDNRVMGNEVVRIISVNSRPLLAAKRKWSCLLWFEYTRNPILVDVSDYFNILPDYINNGLENLGIYNTQIITCPVPHAYSGKVPKAISLQSQGDCDSMQPMPSNILRVLYSNAYFQKTKHNNSIGVCVRALRIGRHDISNRLVEWLELVRIFGADQVYLYVLDVTENVLKVLRHYQKEGFVKWRYLTQPDTEPNVNLLYESTSKNAKHLNLVELNDCLYRNLATHDYLAVMDINEMIVPLKLNNWKDLLSNLEKNHNNFKEFGYYAVRQVILFSNLEEPFNSTKDGKALPKYLYKMRRTYRSRIQKFGIRSFHRTSMVTALHSQQSMACLTGSTSSKIPNTTQYICTSDLIPPRDSLVFNYQMNREPWMQIIANYSIQDRSLWRFLDQIETNVQTELGKIFQMT